MAAGNWLFHTLRGMMATLFCIERISLEIVRIEVTLPYEEADESFLVDRRYRALENRGPGDSSRATMASGGKRLNTAAAAM